MKLLLLNLEHTVKIIRRRFKNSPKTFRLKEKCDLIRESFRLFPEDKNSIKTYFVPRHFKAEWMYTRSICRAYGMDILTLETETEANVFFELFKAKENLFDRYTHIGGMSEDANFLKWYWVTTGELINYEINFPIGEPNRSGLCLAINKMETLMFDDIHCYGGHQEKFICERKEDIGCNEDCLDKLNIF